MIKLNYSRTNFGNEWEYYDIATSATGGAAIDNRKLNKEDMLMIRTQYMF
jgi:hypothetical protein